MIIASPAPVPVTTPAGLTVAIAEVAELHVPPEGVPASGTVALTQTEVPPETEGDEFTVTDFVAKQLPAV